MSKLLQERVILATKVASVFFATMLVVLVGTLLLQDARDAKPMAWPSLAPEDSDDNTAPKWWQGSEYKPVDWTQQTPIGAQGPSQPWTPVTPGQEPEHVPSKAAPPPAPRTVLP
jgi:hypothetical protein